MLASQCMMSSRVEISASSVADSGPLRRVWRNAYPFIVVGLLWEAVARLGIFPVQFFPPLESVGAAFVRLSLIVAAALYETLARSGTFPQALTPTLPTI